MITLTEPAAHKVKEMLQGQDNPGELYLRVGVQSGGCSGFSYGMGFDSDRSEHDITLEIHGVKIIVEKKNEPLLKGTIIDYKESMMGGGFSIENPNASATCGCGSSFRTSEHAGTPGDC
ncbi:iron-sulfur cluster assembly accessory protein [Hazenella sp. IB182357]|uniref:Iron-sulfur cluster assembly accessory protein n=1 Tax=Polycladospora coralii TaxID=2771432 RepID=A0A926N5I2_9BACL|nr:iron-sulfur cluster assembly accessory protein [Polycladospora coralii]MBD1370901.1 iron-sulfur cluster assembly accessory protein [Polycladospora coralii]MBS7529840.1 iron-sulfur cluster assembly accessory protein [Polycladospora coralii]